jgi:hypothetical protein
LKTLKTAKEILGNSKKKLADSKEMLGKKKKKLAPAGSATPEIFRGRRADIGCFSSA